MTIHEFNDRMEELGIDLKHLNIICGHKIQTPFVRGAFQDKNEWVVYSCDERGYYHESFRGNEHKALNLLYALVFSRLDLDGFVTKWITEPVLCTRKATIISYLKEAYQMTDCAANDAWEYLKQDMRVLNEFKYYVLNGEFIPDQHCYKVQGYSAERIKNTTYLSVIGAFNYLIYLKKKPREALADLKAGLPRK